jgi:hypothetical protein
MHRTARIYNLAVNELLTENEAVNRQKGKKETPLYSATTIISVLVARLAGKWCQL